MKRKLKILVVDRPLKSQDHPIGSTLYRHKEFYDVILLPLIGEKRIDVIFFDCSLKRPLEKLFSIEIEADVFYDFDIEGMNEKSFFHILEQEFEIEKFNLTDIEKTKVSVPRLHPIVILI